MLLIYKFTASSQTEEASSFPAWVGAVMGVLLILLLLIIIVSIVLCIVCCPCCICCPGNRKRSVCYRHTKCDALELEYKSNLKLNSMIYIQKLNKFKRFLVCSSLFAEDYSLRRDMLSVTCLLPHQT